MVNIESVKIKNNTFCQKKHKEKKRKTKKHITTNKDKNNNTK